VSKLNYDAAHAISIILHAAQRSVIAQSAPIYRPVLLKYTSCYIAAAAPSNRPSLSAELVRPGVFIYPVQMHAHVSS